MVNKIIEKYKKIPLPAKASMWFVISSFLQKGIAFITTPIFTRLLNIDNYGIITVYNSWVEIIAIFATFQLSTGVFNKAMIKYEKDRDGYTSVSLILSSLITLICFVIYFCNRKLSNQIVGLSTVYICTIFIDIFSSTALSFWTIRNRFEFKYKSVVTLSIALNILGPANSIFLLNILPESHQPIAKIWGMLIVKILINIFIYIWLLQKGKKFFEWEYWKYAISYNAPLIPHYLSQQILSQSDRIMIGKISGIADAGIYGVAYQLSRVVFTFVLAIHQTFTPYAFKNIKERNFDVIKKYSLILEVCIGAACLFSSLFAPELIYILGGEKYITAIWVVPPVAMSVLFQSIYTFYADIEFYYERTKLVMVASVCISIVNVILNTIFIPLYGFAAAGYTTLVCYFLYSYVHYLFMKQICRDECIEVPFYGKRMWGVSIIYIVLSIGVSCLYMYTILRYAVILLVITFFVVICILYRQKIMEIYKHEWFR